MKKIILFIFFLLFICALTTEAQNDTLRFIIKLSPTAILDVDAGIQLGIENRISKNLSLQNELSYLFYAGLFGKENLFNNPKRSDMAGFAYKLELRKYNVSRKKELDGFYWAPQFMYKQINWSEEHLYQLPVRTDTNSLGYYNYNYYNYSAYPTYTKRVVTFNFKIGRQYISSSGFAFDFYLGAGLRGIQTVQTSAKTNFNNYGYSDYNYTSEKLQVIPNFTMGFKLGWYFQLPIVTN